MSITINPNVNLNPANFLPIDSVSNAVNAGMNAAQSGIMQSLSQLFGMLSQLFASGQQNSQFNTNPLSSTLGNTLGNSLNNGLGNLSLSGLQNPQLGGSPINITINNNSGNPASTSTGTDRSVSLGNCQSQPQQPMNADRAAQVLNQSFDNVSGGKETVNRDDLRRALTDPNSSPEVKSMANFLLNNPGAFRKIDTAAQGAAGSGGPFVALGDGRINKGDTVAAMVLSDTQTQPERNAVAALLANKDSLMAGGDKLISKDELGMIATTGKLPNGQPAPADLQQAAKYFTENPAMFNKLEDTNFYRNSNNNIPKGDGKVGLQDMLTALSQ